MVLWFYHVLSPHDGRGNLKPCDPAAWTRHKTHPRRDRPSTRRARSRPSEQLIQTPNLAGKSIDHELQMRVLFAEWCWFIARKELLKHTSHPRQRAAPGSGEPHKAASKNVSPPVMALFLRLSRSMTSTHKIWPSPPCPSHARCREEVWEGPQSGERN